jgi:ATP-binding protein involved in chromosome partitioning
MNVTTDAIEAALQQFTDPYWPEKDLVKRRAIKDLVIEGGKVSFRVVLGYAAAGKASEIINGIKARVQSVPGVSAVDVKLEWGVIANKTQNNMKSMESVRNIIAVASGKGGVGKSTTAVNLALALAAEGARVGILDADIYGPSQPIMLGIPESQRPETQGQQYFFPIVAHGIQSMSMGYLVDEKTPMVWRGPMVSGAMQQLLNQTLWENLDYLVIDMPPGTGDIQLTLAQRVPVTGAVIVTTPQDIALLDAKKGIEMFRKVEIPCLGIIENMALHVCSQCGHVEHIFGQGGGERIAQQYDAPLLGSLPLDIKIREQADGGKPSVVADPDGIVAQTYREIARKLGASLAKRGKNYANAFPEIVVKND